MSDDDLIEMVGPRGREMVRRREVASLIEQGWVKLEEHYLAEPRTAPPVKMPEPPAAPEVEFPDAPVTPMDDDDFEDFVVRDEE